MLSSPSVLPNAFADLLVVAFSLVIFALVGRSLAGDRLYGTEPLERLGLQLLAGLLVTVGVGVTLIYGRLGQHSVVPLLLGLAAVYAVRRLPKLKLETTPQDRWRLLAAVAGVVLASTLFHAWERDPLATDGTVWLAHSDLGYFAAMTKALPLAKVSNGWAPVAAECLRSVEGMKDQWYHWGPVWLGMVIMKVTGLSALESLLSVGSSLMVIITVLLAAAIVRSLTNWAPGWCVLAGALSVFAMPYPASVYKLPPFAFSQHSRDSLLWTFSYAYEGMLVMSLVLHWLRGRYAMAALMLVVATLSSPHFVGGLGPALGALMVLAFIARKKPLYLPAAVAVGVILATWLVLRTVLGLELPAAAGPAKALANGAWSDIKASLLMLALDVPLHLLICILLVPGWVALIRSKALDGRVQTLGWLCLTGILGGMAATHLIDNAESFHFTDFPCSTLAIPAAVWGLALIVHSSQGWRQWSALAAIAVTACFGVTVLRMQKAEFAPTGRTPEQLATLKSVLKGETFGYITQQDRPWWISKCGLLAAMMDSRCVRLNPLKSADVDDTFSKFYHSYLPMELVPYKAGDPLPEWCIKFARKLGVRYILHTQPDPVPAAIARYCRPVFTDQDMILYELKPEAETRPAVSSR